MIHGTLRLDDAQAWLTSNGWYSVSEGPGGWMWLNPDLNRRVGVVRNLSEDTQAQLGLVERIADAHQRPRDEVRNELQFWSIDVTYVRAANDIVVADTIPLDAGATMVDSARLMFRSAASAAMRLRPVINGGYSKVGDEVAKSVRMGHTIKGSYIIPVEVHVGEPDDADSDEDTDEPVLSGWEESAPSVESLERRMTRTFAQAMTAVHREIVRADRLPRGEALLRLVSQGVTAEFVDAVGRVLEHKEVATLDTQFRWAQTQPAPRDVVEKVEIPHSAHDAIRRTGMALRSEKLPRRELFSGPVVRVAHEPGDRTTSFAIRTYRGNRQCRIEAVTKAPVSEVTRWMTNRTTIQISGTVERTSHGLFMPRAKVAELAPLDESH